MNKNATDGIGGLAVVLCLAITLSGAALDGKADLVAVATLIVAVLTGAVAAVTALIAFRTLERVDEQLVVARDSLSKIETQVALANTTLERVDTQIALARQELEVVTIEQAIVAKRAELTAWHLGDMPTESNVIFDLDVMLGNRGDKAANGYLIEIRIPEKHYELRSHFTDSALIRMNNDLVLPLERGETVWARKGRLKPYITLVLRTLSVKRDPILYRLYYADGVTPESGEWLQLHGSITVSPTTGLPVEIPRKA